MPRRRVSQRVRYATNVAFDKKQNNLPEVLTRLSDKVDTKGNEDEIEKLRNDVRELKDNG